MSIVRALAAFAALVAVSACAQMEPAAPPQTTTTTSTPMVAAPPPSPAPAVQDDVALPPSPVVVYFQNGKADITGSTMQILWGLAPALKSANPAVIRVQGFTDGTGKAAYNKALSEKRAQAVAMQLHKLGIAAKVEVMGQGVVKGARKGHHDAGARKVEISWEPAAPAKVSAPIAPVSSQAITSSDDMPKAIQGSVAGAAPAAAAVEAVGDAGSAPEAEAVRIADWAATPGAIGPPAELT